MTNWQKYAIGEAGAKIASSVFQKKAGVAMTLPATGLVYSAIIGAVQIFAGLVFRKRTSLLIHSKRDVMLSWVSGIFASLANVLGPVAFMYGADLAGRTFILTMSVIPSMFLGHLVFGQYLLIHQYVAVAVFCGGVWAILDGPNIWLLLTQPPTWVWLTLILTVSGAVSEAVKMAMSKDYDPMSNNFWVGCSTVVMSLGLFLVLIYMFPSHATFGDVSTWFITASIVTGGIVVIMIAMGLRSYQTGAFIVLKKTLMMSIYLIGAALAGWLVFEEPLTALRILGVVLFVVAVFLSDRHAYYFALERVRKRT